MLTLRTLRVNTKASYQTLAQSSSADFSLSPDSPRLSEYSSSPRLIEGRLDRRSNATTPSTGLLTPGLIPESATTVMSSLQDIPRVRRSHQLLTVVCILVQTYGFFPCTGDNNLNLETQVLEFRAHRKDR